MADLTKTTDLEAQESGVSNRWQGVLPYAVTVFVSAFLLFQIQPVIAKHILPWFGGSAGVWTTCMLFFQIVLLLGYLYAHLSIRYLTPARQAALHVGLLVVSLLLLPAIPSSSWKPAGAEDPELRILGLLAVTIGLPYFLLATTSPMLQAWYSRDARRRPAVPAFRAFERQAPCWRSSVIRFWWSRC